MKFLLIVLFILFIGELLTRKGKNNTGNGDNKARMKSKHPAEYDLR